jgi:transposase
MISSQDLDTLDAPQMREAMRAMLGQIERHGREIAFKQAIIDKLTHENAVLKRLKFAAQSERFNAEQRELLDETLDADLEAVSREIEALVPAPAPTTERRQPKRAPLPAAMPRREIRHEPESTT